MAPDFFDLGLRVVEQWRARGSDWSALDLDEQRVLALWQLDAEMLNGGFLQFFGNHGFGTFERAREALAHVGAVASLACIDEAYAQIAKLEDDPRVVDLHDIAALLSSSAQAAIADSDRRYAALAEVGAAVAALSRRIDEKSGAGHVVDIADVNARFDDVQRKR